jgi:hypothetical protein
MSSIIKEILEEHGLDVLSKEFLHFFLMVYHYEGPVSRTLFYFIRESPQLILD